MPFRMNHLPSSSLGYDSGYAFNPISLIDRCAVLRPGPRSDPSARSAVGRIEEDGSAAEAQRSAVRRSRMYFRGSPWKVVAICSGSLVLPPPSRGSRRRRVAPRKPPRRCQPLLADTGSADARLPAFWAPRPITDFTRHPRRYDVVVSSVPASRACPPPIPP